MKHLLKIAIAVMLMFTACSKDEVSFQNETPSETLENCNSEKIISENEVTLEEALEDLESLLKDFSSLSKSGGGGDFSSRKISDGFTLKSERHGISKSSNGDSEVKIHVFNFDISIKLSKKTFTNKVEMKL